MLSTLYIVTETRQTKEYLTSNLKQATQQLAESVRLPLYAENLAMLQQIADNASRLPEIKAVVIAAADGRVLVEQRAPNHPGENEVISETVQVLSSNQSKAVENTLTIGADDAHSLIGSVRLVRSTLDLSQKIRQLFLHSIILALLVWLVMSSAFYIMLNKFTASFNELMRGLKCMKEGDYTSRIRVLSYDEPGLATQAVNELANKLLQRNEENTRLNQHLLEREQNLKLLLDAMPVGVCWNNSEGAVEYINSFFTDRFGYVREDIKTIDDLLALFFPDWDYREQVMVELGSATGQTGKNGGLFSIADAKITCKDGGFRHVIIKSTKENNRTILIFIDITEREILQKQQIKTQQLESIGILAAGVAHNFNNALTGVLGFVTLAAKQLDESSNTVLILKQAEKATLRAAGMAKQLLAFARNGSLVKMNLSLAKLVNESVSMALKGTKVQSLIQITADVHAVIGDEDQLRQVFSNLAINAVQAMPDGGTLSVRAENVLLDADWAVSPNQHSHICISFSDTGKGIPKANQANIFEPYFTTNPSNCGLGLAMVHSIVHRHGGQITVTSTVGVGTTFTVLLPTTCDTANQEEING